MKEYKLQKKWLTEKLDGTKIDLPDVKDDAFVYVQFMDEKQYKSKKQNDTFHALLDTYWASGCSSFISYEDLRIHYKTVAGLVTRERLPLSDGLMSVLKWLYKQLRNKGQDAVKDELGLLISKGKEKERSWSGVSNKKATLAIQTLIDDMHESRVNTDKFLEILEGMGNVL
jgi:hypothetical protein